MQYFQLFVEGFVLQASLILALGAQNVFLINSGLKKQRAFYKALICSICDLTLILLGAVGVASVVIQIPLLKIGMGMLGVFFLLVYSFKTIKTSFDIQKKHRKL